MLCTFLIRLMLGTRIAHFLLIAVVIFDEEYYVNLKSFITNVLSALLLYTYSPDGFVLKNLVPAILLRVQL